jgi:hypothetical protein
VIEEGDMGIEKKRFFEGGHDVIIYLKR